MFSRLSDETVFMQWERITFSKVSLVQRLNVEIGWLVTNRLSFEQSIFKCDRQIWHFCSFLAPPKITDITIESNNNEILQENEQIILKCSARGTPVPKIIWHIPGKRFLINKRNDRSTLRNQLILFNNSFF